MDQKKRGRPRRQSAVNNESTQTDLREPVTFKIESGVPMVYAGGRRNIHYEKIAAIMKRLKVNESVVFPISCKNVPDAVRKQEDLAIDIRRSVILPDKKFFRVWRVK